MLQEPEQEINLNFEQVPFGKKNTCLMLYKVQVLILTVIDVMIQDCLKSGNLTLLRIKKDSSGTDIACKLQAVKVKKGDTKRSPK